MPWSELTSLGSLTIEDCGKLRALPRGIGKLGALKQFTLQWLYELQEMPDTIGRMTALEHLTLGCCSKLRTLPASIMHLSRLQKLWISEGQLEDTTLCRASRPSRRCMSFALMSQTTRMAAAHSRRCRARCRACSSCKSLASELPEA